MTRVRVRPLLSVNRAFVLGIFETVGVLGYILGGDPLPLQIAALSLKTILLLCAISSINSSVLSRVWWLALWPILIPFINIFVNTPSELISILKIFAFSANLIATLLILNTAGLRHYFKGIALFGAIITAVYIFQVHAGIISNHYGRYYYFNDSHPNLGSEIAAVVVVTSVLTLRWVPMTIISALAFYSIVLMQGRAALLVAFGAFTIRLVIHLRTFAQKSTQNLGIVLGLGILALIPLVPAMMEIGGTLLQIDDEHRGASTGFVGRDRLWANAFELFSQNPFFGVGASYFEAADREPVHNFYLYGLTLYGITSLAIYASLFCAGLVAFRRNPRATMILSTFLILTLFNARFMNLNLYPFVVYVAVFSLAALPSRQVGRYRSLDRARHPYVSHNSGRAFSSRRLHALRSHMTHGPGAIPTD